MANDETLTNLKELKDLLAQARELAENLEVRPNWQGESQGKIICGVAQAIKSADDLIDGQNERS